MFIQPVILWKQKKMTLNEKKKINTNNNIDCQSL